MAEREDRSLAEVFDLRRRKDLRHQAHVAMHAHGRPVRHRDARRLLAAVLERKETEVGQVRDVDPVLGADPEHSAHG